jgi:hypothetical protein
VGIESKIVREENREKRREIETYLNQNCLPIKCNKSRRTSEQITDTRNVSVVVIYFSVASNTYERKQEMRKYERIKNVDRIGNK